MSHFTNWTPLEPAILREEKPKGKVKKYIRIKKRQMELSAVSKKKNLGKVSYHMAKESIRRDDAKEYWANDIVFCSVDRMNYTPLTQIDDDNPKHNGFNNYIEISFHSTNKDVDVFAGIGWQIKQWIKNELCGEEFEGIEIFPAESRMMNTANEYWLWCFPYQLPIGIQAPRNVQATREGGYGKGSKQDLLLRAQDTLEIVLNKKQEKGVV